jgi:hypothetical protein
MVEYDIKAEEVEGWLYVDNGREMGITIAYHDKGLVIAAAVENDIVERLKALGIGALFIDPFIKCHKVQENDNVAIDAVADTWARIASRANCAVELAHHIRKPASGASGTITIDDARGGGALTAAVRTARTVTRMSKADAEKAKITLEQERLSIFRIDDAGGNLAPTSDAVEWNKFHNVKLANGDGVGVVKRWEFPSVFKENAPGDLLAVQRRIASGMWRQSHQCKDWAGNAVAEVLKRDLTNRGVKSDIITMLAGWVKSNALKVVWYDDEKGVSRPWIEVGEWASDFGDDDDDYASASGE